MNKDTATHSKVTGTDFEYSPTTDWKMRADNYNLRRKNNQSFKIK